MSERYEWDWPSRATERRRYFERVIDVDYRVVRRRRTTSLGWALFIVIVGLALVLRFFWPAFIMFFAMLGITNLSGILAVLVLAVIFCAAALRKKLSGRPF